MRSTGAFLTGLILLTATFVGCKDDNETLLSAAPMSSDVSSASGCITISITSNTGWAVETDEDWCIATPSSGNGNDSVTIVYESNPELTSRTANIKISSPGSKTVNVVLNQQGRTQANNPHFGPLKSNPFGLITSAIGINFVDIDDDGDLDAFSISGYGTSYFENSGNKNTPAFTHGISSPFGLNDQALGLSFADLDDDKDFDLITTSGYGSSYFENIGTKSNPQFKYSEYQPLNTSHQAWSLDFADMDNDGDYDLFTVSGYGTDYFENIGSKSHPNFKRSDHQPINPSWQDLGISLVDIDDDGDNDVFTVSGLGTSLCKNTGTKNQPVFPTWTHDPYGISLQGMGIDFVDINNDTDMDVFISLGDAIYYQENLNF